MLHFNDRTDSRRQTSREKIKNAIQKSSVVYLIHYMHLYERDIQQILHFIVIFSHFSKESFRTLQQKSNFKDYIKEK